MINLKTKAELNREAIELRRKFRLTPEIPIDLLNMILCKFHNITIIFHPMSKNTGGMSINNENIQIIAINSDMNLAHQDFMLAHELYHLLIEKRFHFSLCNDVQSDSEKEANIFASFLLMPDEALKNYLDIYNISKLNLDDIIKLEGFFQIGHYDMLIRLKEDDYITEEEFEDYLDISAVYETAIRGFPTDMYMAPEKRKYKVLGKYIRLVNESTSKDLITSAEKQELLSDAFMGDLIYNFNDCEKNPNSQAEYDYDGKGDSLFICLINHNSYEHSIDLDNDVILDLDINYKPMAVEFLNASKLFNVNKDYLTDLNKIALKLRITKDLISLNCLIQNNNHSFSLNRLTDNCDNVPEIETQLLYT